LCIGCESGLESTARDTALSDDGLQRADPDFGMIRNWDCYGSTVGTPLHDDVTASLPNDLEAMLFKDAAHVRPERIRNLPMRRFKAGDKDLCVKPALYFGRIGRF